MRQLTNYFSSQKPAKADEPGLEPQPPANSGRPRFLPPGEVGDARLARQQAPIRQRVHAQMGFAGKA